MREELKKEVQKSMTGMADHLKMDLGNNKEYYLRMLAHVAVDRIFEMTVGDIIDKVSHD